MVGALTDAVSTSLGCGAHSVKRRAIVYIYSLYKEFSILCLTVILLLPVGYCGTQKLLNIGRSSFLGKLQDTQGAAYFHTSHKVYDVAHLAGRGGDISQDSERFSLQGLFSCFS